MLARKLAVLAIASAAGLAFATPAHAAESVDFGAKNLGESTTGAVNIKLTTSAGDIRSAFKSAVSGFDFADMTVGSSPVTGEQVKDVMTAAVDNLDDSAVFAFKIFDLKLTGDADFTTDDGCDGKDGASTATCTVNATFAPTAEGARKAEVDANIGWTGGQDDLTEAIAAAALTELEPPLSDVVSKGAQTVMDLLDEELAELLEDIYNPIAELKGVGVAPGGGGGGGQNPPPGNGNGGGGSGGGSQLPQTGMKVGELAAGGLGLLVLGAGLLFLVRRITVA